MRDCVFCIDSTTKSSVGVDSDRIVKEYVHWWLLLQRADKLMTTKQAAGLLVSRRHVRNVSEIESAAAQELVAIIKDSSKLLCKKAGTTYTGQETVGYNQGTEAGQTVMHAHVHILPVSIEDPEELKVRAGIGGAFEALREKRMGGKSKLSE